MKDFESSTETKNKKADKEEIGIPFTIKEYYRKAKGKLDKYQTVLKGLIDENCPYKK